MKYLDSKPFNIAVSDATEHRPQVVENGGPATRIPDDAKCPSGRHNTRLTECYCIPQRDLSFKARFVIAPDGGLILLVPGTSDSYIGLDRK